MSKRPAHLVVVTFLLSCGLWAQVAKPSARNNDLAVTPVTGESWLIHLNGSFNDSSMGRTGRVGPAPVAGETTGPELSLISMPSAASYVTLRGADLYRLNCRGCHGESGLGAPPEINSVINPVRATSADLVMQRMKNSGMDISRAEAAKLAQQSNAALLQRLHQGGREYAAFLSVE